MEKQGNRFTCKCVKKHLLKSYIFSKAEGQWLKNLLECQSSTGIFEHFANATQLPQ